MRKVCVVVTARPSYAKWKTTLAALKARSDIELQVVVAASANLERYGRVRDVIEADGFPITAECWTVLEGATLLTSARETGIALMDLASVYHRLRPDVVCVMADRHEILAAAAAAKFQHLTLAHVQGGESSGSIDAVVRDAVTHLADLHFPCTEMAAFRVYGLTGAHERIFQVGCGSIDLAKQALSEPPVTVEELGGAGRRWYDGSFTLAVLQHPVTSEADAAYAQMRATLEACCMATDISANDGQVVVLWPGQDAGADGASKAIREFQAEYSNPFHTVRNLPPNRWLRFLTQASVLVGNSSAGIREASYLGVPVVNVGSRQHGRERGPNVIDVPHDVERIREAIEKQIAHGKYPSSALYGRGDAGERIAEVLSGDDAGRGAPEDHGRRRNARVG